ncbi:hypothetical protein SLOPH_962 [Spraguea lophii 42_110]|uniref:Uncharacterized protein n=1 Tax=Spraguea lophii (strain 42_110) TaxID=1358809 RepID=S7XIT1_SPRLO|nr:hypothetical protein SLOPH_962 [Spraguea lophii 42_110]
MIFAPLLFSTVKSLSQELVTDIASNIANSEKMKTDNPLSNTSLLLMQIQLLVVESATDYMARKKLVDLRENILALETRDVDVEKIQMTLNSSNDIITAKTTARIFITTLSTCFDKFKASGEILNDEDKNQLKNLLKEYTEIIEKSGSKMEAPEEKDNVMRLVKLLGEKELEEKMESSFK